MNRNIPRIYILSTLFCSAAAVLSLCLGAARLSLPQLWAAICQGPGSPQGAIFYYVRLPRTAACLLAGAGLAVSGGIIQKVLQNHLASPNIIGVNAGAGLGVSLCCALGLLSGWAITLSAFLGALVCVGLVMLTAKKAGASRATVILGGVAINATFNALSEAITTLWPEVGSLSGDFRVGGFSGVTTERLIPAGLLILAALLVTLTLSRDLDVLALGDETARSLGMRVGRTRTILLLTAAMLAGASVSFAGLLGFVGLIVPHTVRKLIGSQSLRMLPLCAILGAGFVTICDLAARLLFAPFELPVGIVLAALGGPFFIVLLFKQRGGSSID